MDWTDNYTENYMQTPDADESKVCPDKISLRA
jgi:hypothetical protein